ncbi:M1 family metallopeptidase [Gaetbulibacter aestuarii]|uniref:M1 family metallopeptidase n=1 Tax=Gaetbulibacter aestuarii TaxID=1502358 RepID=A0ABW7MVE2_9FLAO
MKYLFSLISAAAFLTACSGSKTIANTQSKINNPLPGYWQQHVDYNMDVDMNVNTYKYTGEQTLVYTNNSPDTLTNVYYHLFFNAFQPGSEMDIHSRTIADPDSRVMDRISKLKPDEIGYLNVTNLKQDGMALQSETVGTILEVKLAKPILPGAKTTFTLNFDGQVPKQIRRSGRNNKEGVALSMTQWYPKLAEYDFEGWHADPYIAREFFGVWGDFDVTLSIAKNYVVGGTGYLQEEKELPNNKKQLHYVAPRVHDFTWVADPDFIHDTLQMPNGPLLNFYYKSTLPQDRLESWKKLQPKTAELMDYYSTHVGTYPYKQYSVIQGGDGGMEYAMCTLITGDRSFGSLVGVTAHELAHTWFQFLLASNESTHPWMDEGFTSYISDLAYDKVMNKNADNPAEPAYNSYIRYAKSGTEQPLTTHADRYLFNNAYSNSAYNKGEVFLAQLGYVIGEDNLKKTIKRYFDDFAFKHPKPLDIIRTAERVSGLELDWYLIDFGETTNTIDYAVKLIKDNTVILERKGLMPMPLDVTVTYDDNTVERFYIPLAMMRGEKPTTATKIADWAWAYPFYAFKTKKAVRQVTIDPERRMADIDRNNNTGSVTMPDSVAESTKEN